MMEVKCTCGNSGCTTKIEIYESQSYIDLIISHVKDGTEKRVTIALDANGIVLLAKQLKEALANLV